MDDRNPTSDRLRRLASRYEAGVGRGRAEQIAARAITRAHRQSSVGRRFAVVVSSGAFVLVSLTGVGFAADRAVPGDVLHPLDRALEAIGFSSDLVEERLLEAITLAERGDMALAVETANEALAELGRSGVTATLPAVSGDPDVFTAETVEETSTTTTEEEVVVETTTVPPADDPADSSESLGESSEPSVEVAAAPADAVETLRLAAQQLLQSVRTAKTDPESTGAVATAALVLAETTAGASGEETSTETTSTTSSTTTTSTTSTTSTTLSEEPRPGNREGNGTNSGTTTTTVASDPDDGSGSDDSDGGGQDASPGPIFLPTP